MRVGINARTLADPALRGWNRYTLNLLRALRDLHVDLVLLSDQPLADTHLERLGPGPRVEIAPPMRYARWEQIWLPAASKRLAVDVLHCPHNFGLPWRRPCPTVLTLHDAIDRAFGATRVPSAPRSARMRTAMHHWVARMRASHIITPSEHAKGDIVRLYRVPAERVSVIAEAAAPEFHAPMADDRRAGVRNRYRIEQPYVFYVGGYEERKHVPLLIRAFAAADLPNTALVLGGAMGEHREPLRALIDELDLTARVRAIGFVPDGDLPLLYRHALCFVYPSLYEGFGLQLCEAMAVGCPVLAANATSLPEVLGNGGELFDPGDPALLARLLQRVAEDAEYRDSLARRARARSTAFSWERTARATLAVYETVRQS